MYRVFYSWQSDLPSSTNRGLIGDARGEALACLTESSASVDPVPDRDTQGVAGAPDIVSTILEKIDAATVFVGDVSLVTPPCAERPSPNPNVLLALGYALRALGPSRVMLVMNTRFGDVALLPFDLRARRVLKYDNDPDIASRADARRTLAKALSVAVQACLRSAQDDEFHGGFASSLLRPRLNFRTLSRPTLARTISNEMPCARYWM